MPSDRDLELIEAYLDDALSAEEVERLDRRLADDFELAQMLHALRAGRAMRFAAFEADAPQEPHAQQLAERIIHQLQRRQRTRIVGRWVRIAGALAACILFGFVAGWLGRGHAESENIESQARGVTHTALTVDPVGIYQVSLTDDSGSVIAEKTFGHYEQARRYADDLASQRHNLPAQPQGSVINANSRK
jgi:anti-sigma factor RsiW